MNRPLYFAAIRCVPAARRWVVRAAELDDLARRILDHVPAGDEVPVAQPHFSPRREPKEFLRWILHEILALDVELLRKWDLSRSGQRNVVRKVGRVELVELDLRRRILEPRLVHEPIVDVAIVLELESA